VTNECGCRVESKSVGVELSQRVHGDECRWSRPRAYKQNGTNTTGREQAPVSTSPPAPELRPAHKITRTDSSSTPSAVGRTTSHANTRGRVTAPDMGPRSVCNQTAHLLRSNGHSGYSANGQHANMHPPSQDLCDGFDAPVRCTNRTSILDLLRSMIMVAQGGAD